MKGLQATIRKHVLPKPVLTYICFAQFSYIYYNNWITQF